MKLDYDPPSLQKESFSFSGSPVCGSTGETFVADIWTEGIGNWTKMN